ncbi:MAG: FmdC precursor, partial [Bacteroidota bacterium]|nr:FmdC precursor [Bacteroidota bacterium]
KSADQPILFDSNMDRINSFYTGWGITAQGSYCFKSNWELAGRYSHVDPDQGVDVNLGDQDQVTLVVSRYISGHRLKVQSDITYTDYEFANGEWQYRLQIELGF